MFSYKNNLIIIGLVFLLLQSCVPTRNVREVKTQLPESYQLEQGDTITSAHKKWNDFFTDPQLHTLIEQALANNQELNIMLQQIAVSKMKYKLERVSIYHL